MIASLKLLAAVLAASAACALAAGLADARLADAQPKQIEFLHKWSGKRDNRDLMKLAPPAKFTVSAETFDRLWKERNLGEKGDKKPNIDFSKQMVIVVVTNGPNSVRPGLKLDDKENLTINASSTLVADDGKTFGFFVGVISREGIEAVNGTPLPKPDGKK